MYYNNLWDCPRISKIFETVLMGYSGAGGGGGKYRDTVPLMSVISYFLYLFLDVGFF
jgi:hypothetical protein